MLNAKTFNDISELVRYFNTQIGDRTKIVSIYFDVPSGAHVLVYWS
jgi:hypothetical protein